MTVNIEKSRGKFASIKLEHFCIFNVQATFVNVKYFANSKT